MAFNACAWTVSSDYDSQSAGVSCEDLGSSDSVVTSIQSATAPNSCKHSITTGSYGTSKEWGGIVAFPQKLYVGDEIWIRIRTFWPNGFNYDGAPALKFLRVHTQDDVNTNYGYNDWYIKSEGSSDFAYFRYEGQSGAQNQFFGGAAEKIQRGVWETYEYYVKLDTKSTDSGGQGIARMWKNGLLIGEITSEPTMKLSQGYADRMHLYTYWNGTAPQTQSMYTDDFIITSTTPGNTDAAGNPFIGAGSFTIQAAPNPPTVSD